MESESPRCFISYSWDSDQHRDWVRKLATRLRECGVDAVLDQFHCAPGMDLTQFMEKSVKESNFVLLVCTPNFARKADAGIGGVGFEKTIVTGEIFTGEAQESKFVPLLREGDVRESLPGYLKNRFFIDLRADSSFEVKIEELLRHFYREPLYPPPPLGSKPDWTKPIVPSSIQKPPFIKTVKNSIGMEFVLILEGSFMMGNHTRYYETADKYDITERKMFEDEEPQHEVTISKSFYLQSTVVTQGQWGKVFGYNPSTYKACGENCPVETVSWEDAQNFIKELNIMEGCDEYRLPTEAEWEYACRAGTKADFSFGDNVDMIIEYAWIDSNSNKSTHPVGIKKPNPWGLYDMHGNVCNWCQDWYGIYPNNSVKDPTGPSKGEYRVFRGNHFSFPPVFSRCSSRSGDEPDSQFYTYSFRCAKTL